MNLLPGRDLDLEASGCAQPQPSHPRVATAAHELGRPQLLTRCRLWGLHQLNSPTNERVHALEFFTEQRGRVGARVLAYVAHVLVDDFATTRVPAAHLTADRAVALTREA